MLTVSAEVGPYLYMDYDETLRGILAGMEEWMKQRQEQNID